MLASRQLPPPVHRPSPPLPIATFYNVPRRYVKSTMQVSDDIALENDVKHPRPLRKDCKAYVNQSSSPSSPSQQTGELSATSPAVSSPSMRKRRATFFEDDGNDIESPDTVGLDDSRAPPSASSTGSGELSGHVCLCQPEPKIPRPRNAFILYRQHHQHTIVARNPSLTNPDISKIIGEQWKSESEGQKKVWQDLAQEEKVRHQEQYPDYRYQPRRLGKPGSLPINPSGHHTTVDKYRCPRCGGRSIKTPTSPFISSPGSTPSLPPLNTTVSISTPPRYPPIMTTDVTVESPAQRRRGPGPSNLSKIQVPPPTHADPGMYSPLTPDAKRRRYNYPPSSNGRRPDGPYFHTRHGSLPPISQMRPSPPNTATMPPPPRTPRDLRRGSMDLNVLVPNQHDQSRSVEAMVMSVPFQVKVKLLGRITPPLKEPGPTSPAAQVRGAIIAIEGDSLDAVKELAEWVKDFLHKENEYSPQIADYTKEPKSDDEEVSFEEYLELIGKWHGRSKEMIKCITTPVTLDKEKGSPTSLAETSIKPVIILPTYQLYASDVYTARIPIQDAYSPTDHWQWMATLWRGTVGPDLTIYVQTGDQKDVVSTPINGKNVELNEEIRLLTVRKDKDKDFEPSALRRVGFEVGEWVRGIGTKTT